MPSLKTFIVKGTTLLLLFSLISCSSDYVSIQFDSEMEVSGAKFSLEDISPGLPSDWDAYNYVILEFMITTPQRFHVGFTTDQGYNELRVMSYTPNGWNRLAIPLVFSGIPLQPGVTWPQHTTSQDIQAGSTLPGPGLPCRESTPSESGCMLPSAIRKLNSDR